VTIPFKTFPLKFLKRWRPFGYRDPQRSGSANPCLLLPLRSTISVSCDVYPIGWTRSKRCLSQKALVYSIYKYTKHRDTNIYKASYISFSLHLPAMQSVHACSVLSTQQLDTHQRTPSYPTLPSRVRPPMADTPRPHTTVTPILPLRAEGQAVL
jgi:hypothetical protein